MLQVTFRHMDSSEALREIAQEQVERLHVRAHGAERCHLVLDLVSNDPERRRHLFSAHVDISFGFPDSLLHASSVEEDAASAVREAFASIERQLTSLQQRHTSVSRAL